MSEESDKQVSAVDDDTALASIIKLAGERPDIPMAVESRVYHRVQEEWQNATASPNSDKVYRKVHSTWRRGNLMRWLLPAGVAATAIMATVFMSQPDPVPLRVVATVSTVIGAEPFSATYASGSVVYAGDVIATGEGEGLSLLLARNESLRIDENTQLRVDATDQYTLLSGRVYADTGQFIYRNGGLKIDTPLGLVTDVGTQFSVTATNESLDVAVREGRVDVQTASQVHAARMGQRMLLAPGEGAAVTDLDTHDDYWDWIVDLTPAFDLTNRSLLDFLKWAARETGRELVFISDESRMSAMRTDVHGSVSGLTPEEALQAILATTTIRYRIELDKIIIES
jgi:ferric-dicitrate binding protein FerR (iron transport regulator)